MAISTSVLDDSLEGLQAHIDQIDPETKAFGQSLRGLPDDEIDWRIAQWIIREYPEEAERFDLKERFPAEAFPQ